MLNALPREVPTFDTVILINLLPLLVGPVCQCTALRRSVGHSVTVCAVGVLSLLRCTAQVVSVFVVLCGFFPAAVT